MEGALWLRSEGGWREVRAALGDGRLTAFEVEDGAPSIPADFGGEHGHHLDVVTEVSGVALGQPHPDPPTNTAFHLVLAGPGDDVVAFCAPSKKELVQWRKAFKAAIATDEQEATASAPAPSEEGKTAANGDDAAVAGAIATEPAASAVPAPAPAAAETPPPAPVAATADAKEATHAESKEQASESDFVMVREVDEAMDDVVTIVVDFEDLEIHISFQGQQDLNHVTVLELKGSVAAKANADPERDQLIRPCDVELRLGDAPLWEHWCGADVGLLPGSHLVGEVRGSAAAAAAPSGTSAAGFATTVQVGDKDFAIKVRDGESVDDVLEAIVVQHGLDPAKEALLQRAAYKALSRHYETKYRSSRAEVGDLKHRLREVQRQMQHGDRPAALSGKVREDFEALLETAAGRIKTLEGEKKSLSDQVFELRLLNAERLAQARDSTPE